jgi:hypothetical protein
MLLSAKKAETRARRLDKIVASLAPRSTTATARKRS